MYNKRCDWWTETEMTHKIPLPHHHAVEILIKLSHIKLQTDTKKMKGIFFNAYLSVL